MNTYSKGNRVTVCKGDTCLTVAGEFAKALAFFIVIGIAALAIGEVAKLFK